jgi:transposase-like protein
MKQGIKQIKMNSFVDMLVALPDDRACREYLEEKIWNGTPICPHCGTLDINHYQLKIKGGFNGLYKCKHCRERFTVTINTMFEGSHIPLRKWFIAIYIFSLHKKGVSSHQLASDLGITQKSAWFMLSRIRKAFEPKKKAKIDGAASADECFIGGKNRNRHADKKVPESQGRSVKDKTPVFGLKHIGGDMHTRVVPDTKATTLKPIISEMMENGSIVVTDEWLGYSNLSENFNHIVINHNEGEYVRGGFTTNNVENFWSLLKRGIYGIYHQVSAKHLNKYCDEFAFRFNARNASTNDKFDYSLTNSTKLTYKSLIEKQV